MMKKLRRKLHPAKLLLNCFKGTFKKAEFSRQSDKVCWLIGTPEHRNLGDHAIAYATMKFVANTLPDYQLIEITEENFYNNFIKMRKSLMSEDIIMLQGGGNFGNLYSYTEDIRRLVIRFCKRNPIIMMPQTICFTTDEIGKKELKITKKIYKKNKNVYFFAREDVSEKLMTDVFGDNVVSCIPDIVLSLGNVKNVPTEERKGILCCLRDDKESDLTEEIRKKIVEMANEIDDIYYTDTIDNCEVLYKERIVNLERKWEMFGSSKLVITDRLHGMIFSVITNTPCIVFSNNNHKIRGVCKWLTSFKNVTFVENCDELSLEFISNAAIYKDVDSNCWNYIDNSFEPLRVKLLKAIQNG